MLKSKKLILTSIVFTIIMLFAVKVNAVGTIEDLAIKLNKGKVSIEDNTITLQEDIEIDDGIEINEGNYIIDLNGKQITYDYKDYKAVTKREGNIVHLEIVPSGKIGAAFYLNGGNLTIKDSKQSGKINTNGYALEAKKGLLVVENGSFIGSIRSVYDGKIIIENGKFDNKVYISNDGFIEIENGTFNESIEPYNGTVIINDGIFNSGIYMEIIPEANAKLKINGGKFINSERSAFVGMNSKQLENVSIKGGTFIGNKEEGAIKVISQDDGFYDLNKLLAKGYKYSNNTQNKEVEEYTGWKNYITRTLSEVRVVKENENVKDLKTVTFLDSDGTILKTVEVLEGDSVIAPEVTEKEGYKFVGWSKDIDNISKDEIIVAKYEKINQIKLYYVYDAFYTGKEIKSEIIVVDKQTNNRLTEGLDYEVAFENNIDAGIGKVKVTGIGKYKFSEVVEGEFKIAKRNIYGTSSLKIVNNKEYYYTGNEIKPEVKVTFENIELKEGKDFIVTYKNNINVGNAVAEVEGIGNFEGTASSYFKIIQLQLPEKDINVDLSDKIYTGKQIRPEVTIKNLVYGTDYEVVYNNNIATGKAEILISGCGKYTGVYKKTFNIVNADITKLSIEIDTSNKGYTGKSIETSVVIKNGSTTLVKGTDYTVTYSNNKAIGTATIKVTGKGRYSGTITKTFKIVPKTLKITSVKNTILRCVKIEWEKDSNVKGYEIYRSTSLNGTYSKVETVKLSSITSHTFLAQAKGTYYYKVRSYTTVNGTQVYGDFSDVMSIKVTK